MAIAIFPLFEVDDPLISQVFSPFNNFNAHFSLTIKALLGSDMGANHPNFS